MGMEFTEGMLITYFLVIVNFLFNRLKDFSCHTQKLLTDVYMKHVFNLFAIFFTIVLFTRSTPIHPIYVILVTLLMYVFFMMITRCHRYFLLSFLVLMTIIFYLESIKAYNKSKNKDPKINKEKTYNKVQFVLQMVSIVVVIIGFVWYILLKRKELAIKLDKVSLDKSLTNEMRSALQDKFSWGWGKFFFSKESCKGDGLPSNILVASASDD